MANYAEFDSQKINEALAAAKQTHQKMLGASIDHTTDISGGGGLRLSGGCVSVTVDNGQVCVNLPLGLGSVCLPIPVSFPSGTAAQACLSICTTWGIPTGVQVTVSIAGNVIVQQSFGHC